MESPTIYAAAVVVAVALACYWLTTRLANLAGPLIALREAHKDALLSISLRADKAEKLAEATLSLLANFERAVGDKRSLEAAANFERVQSEFMRERVAELQRAVIGLANPKVEATVVGQTSRDKDGPEIPVAPGPSRWQAANGTSEPLTAELTRNNPSTTYKFKGPSDYAGLARRESGPNFASNDEAL